jgi:hypothetical protein
VTSSKDMESRSLDIGEAIAALARHAVDYVVIGSLAAQVHGLGRAKMTLELTPDPDVENLERLDEALAELEAQPLNEESERADIPIGDQERFALAAVVPPLLTRHGQVHVLKEPKGARTFEKLREAALVVELGGVEVAIVSLDDLIRMKRAAGRPADLEDVAALIEAEKPQRD